MPFSIVYAHALKYANKNQISKYYEPGESNKIHTDTHTHVREEKLLRKTKSMINK